MANRFWVGGTASWDATAGTKWALTSGGAGGQAVPTSADDVFFNAASGTVTVTLSGLPSCLSLNCTGFTGTLAGTAGGFVAGSLTLSTSMIFSNTGTWEIDSAGTITSAGKTFTALTIAPGSGTVTIADNLVVTNTLTHPSTGGATLTVSNVNVTIGTFATTGTGARTLNMGNGTWTTTGTGSVWSIPASGYTLNAGSSTLKFTDTSATQKTFGGSGKTYNNVWFAGGSGDSVYLVTGANTINNLKVDGGPHRQVSFIGGVTQTVNSLTLGASATEPVLLISSTIGTAYTLSTTSAIAVSYVGIRDMTKSGTGSITVSNGLDLGGNSGITFSTSSGGETFGSIIAG